MSNLKDNSSRAMQLCSILLLTSLIAASVEAQTPAGGNDNRDDTTRARALMPRFRLPLAPVGFRLMSSTNSRTKAGSRSGAINLMPMAAGPNLQVMGGGTLGRLTKWTGFTSSNSFIGDTTIFEDKFGNVGIGTDSPTSKLTVAGTIQASGGSSVLHDATLSGNGTSAAPLGVAVPLTLNGSVPLPELTILTVRNDGGSGSGVLAVGSNSNSDTGGDGVIARGGFSASGFGGKGLDAAGGNSTSGFGGDGLFAAGGSGFNQGGNGIFAVAGSGPTAASIGAAGFFIGNVQIVGNLNVGGTKNFKIDHPLDPENKYLYHAAIESSEVLNIYSGNVTTNENGEATVTMPDWFEALNKDFRYQLTSIGAPAQGLYIAEKVNKNRFKIAGAQPGMEVSWQVIGVRSDAVMVKHPFKAEEDKPERERGTYVSPEAYGQPEERGAEWARQPEVMRQMKERREQAYRRVEAKIPKQ